MSTQEGTSRYTGRHVKVAKITHWDKCKEKGVEVSIKWYAHVPEKVGETTNVKILCDFNIQTNHVVEHRWPNVVVLDKADSCHLVEIAVPANSRVDAREKEKIQKFQDLVRELRKVWEVKVKVVPVVEGTIPRALEKHLGRW